MLLTITEAAEKVGRSRKWFYQHALPNVRTKWVGNVRYVVADSLDEWVNDAQDGAA
jgi:predicted DNA-binding transcriptional regulator AlpA